MAPIDRSEKPTLKGSRPEVVSALKAAAGGASPTADEAGLDERIGADRTANRQRDGVGAGQGVQVRGVPGDRGPAVAEVPGPAFHRAEGQIREVDQEGRDPAVGVPAKAAVGAVCGPWRNTT